MHFKEDSSFEFPDYVIEDSKKDETYHKKFTQAIVYNSVNGQYDIDHASMNESYNFYQGLQGGEEFNFLQEAEDGDALPAQWINYNKIKVKIDLLLGELLEKGFEINVRALNKDAKIRKLEEKNKLRVMIRMREVAQMLEKEYDMAFDGAPDNLPESEEDLDEYFDKNYKETCEIIMNSALKYLSQRNKWAYERYSLFRDILITGRCFCKSEIVNGIPEVRRIDPRLVIFDPHSTDDFLSDSSYFGEVRYMNIADAVEQFGLSKKELKDVYTSFSSASKGADVVAGRFNDFKALQGTNLKWFNQEGGELRILVISAVWKDTKDYNHKESVDQYGNNHIKRIKGRSSKGNVIQKRIATWRQGTLIGGQIFRNWGEIENQPRNVDNLSETTPPYKGLIPNYLNYRGVSKVEQLKGLQKLKDITMYNIQLTMARAGGKGFVYDVSQCPEEWDPKTVIKYLKTVGIAFIDSRKDGIPAQFNQFQQLDLSLSSSVEQYISISSMVDREMDAISGINEARQGLVQNASQAVGVTQSALLQSNLTTAPYYKLFHLMNSDVWTHQAGLVKVAWEGKERFAPIIGDTGIDFLANDVDLELQDYGVAIEEIPPLLDDINNFQNLVMAAIQSGKLEFADALDLLREKDITMAIRRFQKTVRKREEQMMQQQQEQMKHEQEMAKQAQQSAEQNRTTELNASREEKESVQKLKNEGDLQKTLAGGRVDLSKQQMSLLAQK